MSHTQQEKAEANRLLSANQHPGYTTDSGVGSSGEVSTTDPDIDDDILNIVQACQDPGGYLKDIKMNQQNILTSNVTLELDTSLQKVTINETSDSGIPVMHKAKTFMASPVKNLPCLDVKDGSHGLIYGATSGAYKKYEWTGFQYPNIPSPREGTAQNTHRSQTAREPDSGQETSEDFAFQVNALKQSLRDLEKEGSIVTLVNAVTMVQSLERFNWKSVLRLLDRNPTAGKELMNLYAMNLKKKQPILGNILTPEYKKKATAKSQLSFSVEGSPCREASTCSSSRRSSVKLPSRQFRPIKMHRTPGELALLEGRQANKRRTPKHKKRNNSPNPLTAKSHNGSLNLPQLPTIHPNTPRGNNPMSPSGYCAKPFSPNTCSQRLLHLSEEQYNHVQDPASNFLDVEGVHLPTLNKRSLSPSRRQSPAPSPEPQLLEAPHPSMVSFTSPRPSRSPLSHPSLDSNFAHPELLDQPTLSHVKMDGEVRVPSLLLTKYQAASSSGPDAPPATPSSPLPDLFLTSQAHLAELCNGERIREEEEEEEEAADITNELDIVLSSTTFMSRRERDDHDSDISSVSEGDLDP